MWKDSLRLGIAKSTAKDVGADGLKCTFIVALYRPPGKLTYYVIPLPFKETYYVIIFQRPDLFHFNDLRFTEDVQI